MGLPAPPQPLRLFVALWPPARARTQLAAWRDGWTWTPAARPVADERLHLTLHFLGAVPAGKLAALEAALDVASPPFELAFGEAAVWRGGTAVLQPLTVPPALAALHARLGEALQRIGLAPDPRPWRPHVTLARRAAGAQPNPRPPALRWRVRGHVLVQSGAAPAAAGAYCILRRYPAPGRRDRQG